MLEEGAKQILAVVGIAVIGYVGENVLLEFGKKHLAMALRIVEMIIGLVIGLKFLRKGINIVESFFHLGGIF